MCYIYIWIQIWVSLRKHYLKYTLCTTTVYMSMTWLTSVFPAKHNLVVLICDILYSTTPHSCLQLLPNNWVLISLPYTFDSEWSFVYSHTITMRCYLSSTNQGMISLVVYQIMLKSNSMCQPGPIVCQIKANPSTRR